MKNDDFKHLYDFFVRNYLHYDPAYGLLIQTPFFNKLYEQWIAEHNPSLFQQNQLKHISYLIDSPFFEKCYEESLRERGFKRRYYSSKGVGMSCNSSIGY